MNWALCDQLVRSATSVGANVVEGGSSSSKREFINFFRIALKSATETFYWLSLFKEIENEDDVTINTLLDECNQIKKLLSTIILNTKSNFKL